MRYLRNCRIGSFFPPTFHYLNLQNWPPSRLYHPVLRKPLRYALLKSIRSSSLNQTEKQWEMRSNQNHLASGTLGNRLATKSCADVHTSARPDRPETGGVKACYKDQAKERNARGYPIRSSFSAYGPRIRIVTFRIIRKRCGGRTYGWSVWGHDGRREKFS